MEQTLPAPAQPKPPSRLKQFFERWTENPVILKELRKRMRRRRTFVLLFAYLLLISIFTVLIYWGVESTSSGYQWNPGFRQTLGKTIFGTVVISELLLVTFIAPALTSGAISSERELQTFELLRTTLLSAPALVFGKLGSSLAYLFLLIFAAVPIEGLSFLFGGVGMAELLISSLMLVVTAFFFATLGLFFSSISKRTSTSTVLSYGAIIVFTISLGIVAFIITSTYSYNYNTSAAGAISEYLMSAVVFTLLSLNPVTAAVMSEALLVNSQSLFYTNQSLFGGNTFFFPSPWIPYVIIHTALAIILLALSVYFVSRPES